MERKRKIVIIVSVLLALVLLCGVFLTVYFLVIKAPEPKKLSTPNVILSGDFAIWDADPLAEKFEISVNGVIAYVENSVSSQKLEDGQVFKVRAVGDGEKYATSDWSNIVTYVDSSVRYTITWKNDDEVLKIDSVPEGIVPSYDGATPTKVSNDGHSYVFDGWTPDIVAAYADATYNAVFIEAQETYTITWKNGDTVLEVDENVPFGATPSYDGATPKKDSSEQYDYTFSGWSPEVSMVKASITYYAQFTESIRHYTVTFYSEDGATILDTATVEYGSAVRFSKPLPVKNPTAGHTYIFDKWVTSIGGNLEADLSFIVGETSVYASFRAFVRSVSVYIVSNNIDYGMVSVSVLNGVPYGAPISIDGNSIIINDQVINAYANSPTSQYTYSFSEWTAPSIVGNDTIITANFSRTTNRYTVTWKNGDEVLEIDENVEYGVMPVYNGEPPTKPYDGEFVYKFSGWDPAVSIVTDNVTYSAQFTIGTNKYTVKFYNDDGTSLLGVAVIAYGETATYPNAIPTKTATEQFVYSFEKWVTVNGGDEEAILTNVKDDMSVYAKFISTVRTYQVTFRDYDGEILLQVDVEFGQPATPPGEPERTGFRFDCWDKDFDNITEELIVTAKYVQQFTVIFMDYDNSMIDYQIVDYDGNAIAPENPVRSGYRFVGWDRTFENVVSDLTINAQYVKQYRVQFLDKDGSLLKEMWVDAGSDAIPPENLPSLEAYDFVGWDEGYENVQSDSVINALYHLKKYSVKFVMPDGKLIDKIQTIEHGSPAVAPEVSEYFLVGAGDAVRAYGFTRWDREFNSITEDIEIKAVYESPYTKLIIIIEFSQEINGNVNLYVLNSSRAMLNAIEFAISFKSTSGNIVIDTVTPNRASQFFEDDKSLYVVNNNEKIFTFAWSDVDAKNFVCSKVVTFSFSTDDGAFVNQESFFIESCSAVITVIDNEGEQIEKITPEVAYRY